MATEDRLVSRHTRTFIERRERPFHGVGEEPFTTSGRAAGTFSVFLGLNDMSLACFLLTEREPRLAIEKPLPAF